MPKVRPYLPLAPSSLILPLPFTFPKKRDGCVIADLSYRRSPQEIHQDQGHQDEDPVQAVPVHSDPEGLRQGRQDQAEFAAS